jgi:hypothetical protein
MVRAVQSAHQTKKSLLIRLDTRLFSNVAFSQSITNLSAFSHLTDKCNPVNYPGNQLVIISVTFLVSHSLHRTERQPVSQLISWPLGGRISYEDSQPASRETNQTVKRKSRPTNHFGS